SVSSVHYMMVVVHFAPSCRPDLAGLYPAGEDTAGVHGANRLGGNGVAESIVFGGVAGDVIAEEVGASRRAPARLDAGQIEAAIAAATTRLGQDGPDRVPPLREALKALMWEKVGLVRRGEELETALAAIPALR